MIIKINEIFFLLKSNSLLKLKEGNYIIDKEVNPFFII